jgi:hypothetical protein
MRNQYLKAIKFHLKNQRSHGGEKSEKSLQLKFSSS